MADSSQYNLSLVITANNKAVEELNKIGASVDKVKGGVSQLSESTKKTLKSVGATATAVAGSVALLGKSFIDSALENEPLQRSYERLTESAGIASDEMLNAMRKASKGTVADTKLMSAANTALSLNVVKSADDMATLMEIARVKGQAMGRSMEEALDDIVRGLGRSSPMILDNLGIVINQTEAQKEYAKELGKTVDQLTEAEKKQALVNAVVKQGKKELQEAGETELTMAEKLQIVNAQWENMKNTIGNALLPILQKVLDILTPVIEKVSARIEENPELTAKILLVVGAVSSLVAILSGLALALPGITTAVSILTSKFSLLSIAVIGVFEGLKRLEDKVVSTDEKIEMYQQSIEELKKKLDNGEISQEEFTEAVAEYKAKIQEAYEESNTFGQYLKDQLDDTLKVMTFDTDRRSQAWTDFGIIFNAIGDMFDNFAARLCPKLIEGFTMFGNVVNAVGGFFDDLTASIINFVSKGVDRAVGKIQTLISKLKSLIETAKEAISLVGGKVSSARESVKGGVSSLFGKAGGGVVYGGETYLVGEHGPELFTPSQRGTITPNNQITNNNGIEVNISGVSVRNDNDITALANEIIRQIKLEKEFGIA